MAGVTKKIDMYDFPLHDCTATQESNKTVTKQDTGTTQQQKKWPDKPLWGTCAYRAVAVPEKGGHPPSFGRKPRPTWLRQTDTSLWQFFLNSPPPPSPPVTSRSGSATAVIPLFPVKSRGEEWRHAHHHGSTISGWQQKVFVDKTANFHVHHAILFISFPSLNCCDLKLHNFTRSLYGVGKHNTKVVSFLF